MCEVGLTYPFLSSLPVKNNFHKFSVRIQVSMMPALEQIASEFTFTQSLTTTGANLNVLKFMGRIHMDANVGVK